MLRSAANRSKYPEEITVSIMAEDDTGKIKAWLYRFAERDDRVAFEQKATDGDDHDRGKERLGSARSWCENACCSRRHDDRDDWWRCN